MDWSRAKTMLIVSFLLLNVLLGYQLYDGRMERAMSQSDSSSMKELTNRVLAAKNIKVALKTVPKETPKLKALYYKEAINQENDLTVAEPFEGASLFARNARRDALTRAGIVKAEAYRLDPATGGKGIQIYHQVHDGLPMFDITLRIFESSGKITGYKQAYVEVQSGGDAKEQRVISAYTALRSVAESTLKEGSTVTDIRLGYHGQRFNSDTQYMLPNWRVVLSTGEIYYVQAFNGAVEKPSERGLQETPRPDEQ